MSTITTIQAADQISASRAVINSNFQALNTTKVETSLTIAGKALTGNILLYGEDLAPQSSTLTNNVVKSLFEVALTSGQTWGGEIVFSLQCVSGSDLQVHTGRILASAVNRVGTISSQVVDLSLGSSAQVLTLGTLSETWGVLAGSGKITLQATFNTSLPAPTLVLWYSILKFGANAITIL